MIVTVRELQEVINVNKSFSINNKTIEALQILVNDLIENKKSSYELKEEDFIDSKFCSWLKQAIETAQRAAKERTEVERMGHRYRPSTHLT